MAHARPFLALVVFAGLAGCTNQRAFETISTIEIHTSATIGHHGQVHSVFTLELGEPCFEVQARDFLSSEYVFATNCMGPDAVQSAYTSLAAQLRMHQSEARRTSEDDTHGGLPIALVHERGDGSWWDQERPEPLSLARRLISFWPRPPRVEPGATPTGWSGIHIHDESYRYSHWLGANGVWRCASVYDRHLKTGRTFRVEAKGRIDAARASALIDSLQMRELRASEGELSIWSLELHGEPDEDGGPGEPGVLLRNDGVVHIWDELAAELHPDCRITNPPNTEALRARQRH